MPQTGYLERLGDKVTVFILVRVRTNKTGLLKKKKNSSEKEPVRHLICATLLSHRKGAAGLRAISFSFPEALLERQVNGSSSRCLFCTVEALQSTQHNTTIQVLSQRVTISFCMYAAEFQPQVIVMQITKSWI